MKYLLLENEFCQKNDPIICLWDSIPKEGNDFRIIEYVRSEEWVYC